MIVSLHLPICHIYLIKSFVSFQLGELFAFLLEQHSQVIQLFPHVLAYFLPAPALPHHQLFVFSPYALDFILES